MIVNLKKLAYDAIATAKRTPNEWVNPLAPHLQSKVRYACGYSEIEAFLLEEGVEDAHELAQTCTNGYFQVNNSRTKYLKGDTDPDYTVTTFLLMFWYDEIEALGYSEEITRLIKQKGGIEVEKIESIKYRYCFSESSSISGFKRFVSADRRFPMSISYPKNSSFYYDFTCDYSLNVDWDHQGLVFGISCKNLTTLARTWDSDINLLLQGKIDLALYHQQYFAQVQANARSIGPLKRRKVRVENRVVGERERPFAAKRLLFQTPAGEYAGERVGFLRFQREKTWFCSTEKLVPGSLYPQYWIIYNESLEKDIFDACVSSFRWLNEDFFRSLPAHPL